MAKVVASRKEANKQKKQVTKLANAQSNQLSALALETAKLRLKVKSIETACGTPRIWKSIRGDNRSQGLSVEYEAFVRSILATGCSARQARDNNLLTAHFLLPAKEAEHLCSQVPDIPWFARQREALGLEALVYAFLALGSAP